MVVHQLRIPAHRINAARLVTTKTRFGIGSITKSFGAVTLGILVDEGQLDWDTPVREYLPGFRLHDPVAGARVTPRDLMSHRSGLPEHEFFMYNCGFTREEMFERLRHLELNKDLRTTFQYSNLMVMIAGYMAGQLNGTTWEELAQTRVLDPLGMTGTDFSIHESRKTGDFALGYQRVDDEVTRIRHLMLDFDAEGAAGTINSAAEDMSRYLLFHLNQGRHNEVQPICASLPPTPRRVGLRIVSFGAASVFTRVTACQLADNPKLPPFSQASTASLPPRSLR